jgi:hypothetical protein
MAVTGSGCGILLLRIQVVLPENLLVKNYSNAYPQKHLTSTVQKKRKKKRREHFNSKLQ